MILAPTFRGQSDSSKPTTRDRRLEHSRRNGGACQNVSLVAMHFIPEHFTFDTWLALAAFVIAAIGLFVAVPPFVQMIWGRPSVVIRWGEEVHTERKLLIASLANEAVRNRFLLFIGVSRQPVEVSAGYEIYEKGTNRQVVPMNRTLIRSSNEQFQLFVPLPTSFPARFNIVSCEEQGVFAIRRDRNHQQIPPGLYYVKVLATAGDRGCDFQCDLQVGLNRHETRWVP
jgi:hypothetical protein